MLTPRAVVASDDPLAKLCQGDERIRKRRKAALAPGVEGSLAMGLYFTYMKTRCRWYVLRSNTPAVDGPYFL